MIKDEFLDQNISAIRTDNRLIGSDTRKEIGISATWGTIVSIVGFITGILCIVSRIFFFSKLYMNNNLDIDSVMIITLLLCLVLFLGYIFLNWQIYLYGTKTKKAIETIQSDLLAEAIGNLRTYFKVVSISLFVILGLLGIILLLVLLTLVLGL